MGYAIERMLNVNRTLKVLNLSGCGVTDPIARHILTRLYKNTSPFTLGVVNVLEVGIGSNKLSVS